MPVVKSGIKTSEFWVTLVTTVLVMLIMGGAISLGINVDQETILTVVAAPVAYIVGRAFTKGKSAEAETKVNATVITDGS